MKATGICGCGKSIEKPTRGPYPSLCRDCRIESGHWIWSEKRKVWDYLHVPQHKNTVPCKACGRDFERIGVARKRCDSCTKLRRANQRTCKGCNRQYPATRNNIGYCSPSCANRDASKRTQWCVCGCGEVFVGPSARKPGKCWTCRREGAKRSDCECNSRRRARQAAAVYEKVDRVEVFERDGWVCQLCGDPVDREATTRTAMSATLDHIIPVSRGGPHTMGNLQCAHFRCNLRKANHHPGEGGVLVSR